MIAFLTVVHIVTCIALVAVVLLQHGKGADIGVSLGGGSSNTMFGARGSGNFLTRLTTGAAILFMTTSLVLSYFGSNDGVSDLLSEDPIPELSSAEPETPESSFPDAAPLAPTDGEAPAGFEEIPAPETATEDAENAAPDTPTGEVQSE